MIPALGLAPITTQPYILVLLAISAVWLMAGWRAYRTSHRAARLWAAAALFALAAMNVAEITQSPGPWWPLVGPGWNAIDGFAALLWIAGLVLTVCARQWGLHAGQAIMACAIAAFAFGLVSANTGHSRDSGGVCLGKSASIGPWSAKLRELIPVADWEYTGLQATLELRSGDGLRFDTQPEDREYLPGGRPRQAGSSIVQRWNGELLVVVNENRNMPECIDVTLEWRGFAQWLRYGAWLSLVGAVILLAAACRSALWRAAAWQRIAMRREDLVWRTKPAVPAKLSWEPLGIALALGFIGLTWQMGRRTPDDISPKGATINAPALIAARGAMNGGRLSSNHWIIIADALMRHNQPAEAVGVLRGVVEAEPDNAEGWLAMGDALFAQSAGANLGGAANYAYYRADQAEIRAGRAPLLVSELMLRSGRRELAMQWLERKLREDPPVSAWRGEFENRLASIKLPPPGHSGYSPPL